MWHPIKGVPQILRGRGPVAHVGSPPPTPRGVGSQGGRRLWWRLHLPPHPYIKRVDPLSSFILLDLWLSPSLSSLTCASQVLESTHRVEDLHHMRVVVLLDPQSGSSSSAASLDWSRGTPSTPYACRTIEVLPAVALHPPYVYSILRSATPYTITKNVTFGT
jgi:hypothetical protein